MNREIKIITLGDIFKNIETEEKAFEFKNYITNLQENYEKIYNENCKLRKQHNINDISLLDENHNLQQENERLKDLCNKYEKEHSTAFKLWTMKMEEMPDYAELQDYKSRCEKAISKIKLLGKYDGECCTRNFKMMSADFNDLLNILKGSGVNE